MRIRSWHTLLFIILLTLFAGWVDLPGDMLNIGGFKDEIQVREGLDLQGGLQVTLQANPPAGQEVDQDTLDGARNTIERRVNGLGVSEPLIQTRGNNQILVELPGVDDPEQAVGVIRETALLEIIDPQGLFLPAGTVVTTTLGGPQDTQSDAAQASPQAATPGAGGIASPFATPGTPAGATPEATPVATSAAATAPENSTPTGPVYTTIIDGSELADAYTGFDQTGRAVVRFELKGGAADEFFQYTNSHIGQPMSIAIDKRVISSPVINGPISNEGEITGMSPAEVTDLVIQLKAGALNVPLDVVQSRTVGPTLGADSIDRSIVAGAVGLGIVALFMIVFYRLPGILSVVALLIYTAVTFAIFKLIPVTLTLAGIAGFILSIGMAVDANVLIFARLKEELRRGRTLSSAIEAGFDHAWPSIRDSNITTMITTFILYLFGNYTGTSIITGFALTLFIGVAVSMFTAIIVTRTFLRLMFDAGLARHRWWFGVEGDAAGTLSAGAAD